MDKLQPITRRAALIGALVSSATVAIPLATLSARADDGGICELIAEHRRLYDALTPLYEAQEASEARFDRLLSPLVPLSLTPDGRRGSGSLELRLFGKETVAAEIRKSHDELIRLHCSNFREVLVPGNAAAFRAAIDASLQRCLAALDEAQAELEQQMADCGVTEAKRRSHEASQAEIAACLAVFAYAPRTTAEAQTKAEWIAATLKDRGDTLPDDDEWLALLGSVGKAVLA